MSLVPVIAFAGIGAAVGVLGYYAFFRKPAKIEEKRLIEEFIRVPVSGMPESAGGRVKIEAPKVKAVAKPLKGVCTECNTSITLPFRCKFCGELHCGEHRLPENHECASL